MEVNLPSQDQSSTVYIPALQIDLFKDDITTVFGEERGAFSGRWTARCRVDSSIRDVEVSDSRRPGPGPAGAAELMSAMLGGAGLERGVEHPAEVNAANSTTIT